MALLTVDKIEQLRVQLEACTNHQTAAALKVAIARLESQLHPPTAHSPSLFTTDEILQPLIDKGSIKIYNPCC
ncbi:hypothetical protein [Acaryochloris sp. IP29b_bin.148]|uniref:hypothetical protein n=1 Tax=Acaryochloris sp. IP29b_bin.148 TaxID=2969218 RepID=UPI002614F6EE|nr:hypothetical protein [Acaryochloris sp. IP29b_bin.148]